MKNTVRLFSAEGLTNSQNGFSEKRRVATEEVRFQCKNGFSESLSFCSKVVSCVSFYRMIILVVDFFSRACGADVSFSRPKDGFQKIQAVVKINVSVLHPPPPPTGLGKTAALREGLGRF